jgi:hypothetical protein
MEREIKAEVFVCNRQVYFKRVQGGRYINNIKVTQSEGGLSADQIQRVLRYKLVSGWP